MGWSPPTGGGGGGAVSSVFGRTGAVVATTGDYNAAEVTNAADKSSGSTQAFTGSITSNGNIGGQRINSNAAGATGAFIGRHDGGAPAGNHSAGDWSVDYTTPGIWMTSAGGSPPTDWENLLSGVPILSLNYNITTLSGVASPITLTQGNLYNVTSMTSSQPANLPSAASAGVGRWLSLSRTDNSPNTLSLTPNGTDTIGGVAGSIGLSQGDSITLISDGTSNWLPLDNWPPAPVSTVGTLQSYN